MNKRIIVAVLAMILLAMMFAAVPVMAKPTVTTIKAIQQNTSTVIGDTWTTNGGIIQSRDVINQGTITLYNPSTAGSPTYTFNHYNIYNRMQNPDKLRSVVLVDVCWNYIVNGITLGTFEGQIQWNFVDGVPQAHGVLHGTEMFEGQQLMFWKDNTQPGIVWVGTLMVK
jgi:hypothetical protein